MTRAEEIAAYTTRVLRARAAYRTDRLAADGLCINDDGRPRYAGRLRCRICLINAASEGKKP